MTNFFASDKILYRIFFFRQGIIIVIISSNHLMFM